MTRRLVTHAIIHSGRAFSVSLVNAPEPEIVSPYLLTDTDGRHPNSQRRLWVHPDDPSLLFTIDPKNIAMRIPELWFREESPGKLATVEI